MELCARFTSDKWRTKLRPKLDGNDRDAWAEAISVFERRLKERFFRCIEALLKSDKAESVGEPVRPGFSIMALCCLLIETLQSFYEGGRSRTNPDVRQNAAPPEGPCEAHASTARAFKDFLKRSKHFNSEFNKSKIRGDFATDVRNAILHEAETRGGWLIESTTPRGKMVQRLNGRRGYILNRTEFYEALRSEFDSYLERLHDESEQDLRRNFLKKMDQICKSEPRQRTGG